MRMSVSLFAGAPAPALARAAILAVFALGCGEEDEDKKPPTYGTMKPPPQGWKAAVGDGGTLVETFDDASWEVRKVTDRDLHAVSCVDNEVGWAVGEGGFIGHTQDGGWSWPAQHSGVTQTLRAVSFAFGSGGGEVGLAAGDEGTLVTTRDGGDTWTRAELGRVATLRGTAITEGATVMLAVGDGGVLARSLDQGVTFETYRIVGAADLYDIAFDAAGGLALATDSAGAIWVSRDRGVSFELEHTAPEPLESISLGRTGRVGSAAGGAQALLRSDEGVWTSIAGVDAELHATLVGPREDRVYFAGAAGMLLETVDLGQSLFRVQADTQAALRGIEDLEPR